jgi:hypothetical protein
MPHDPLRPDFDTFTRWLAANNGDRELTARSEERHRKLIAAARAARDEMLRAIGTPLTSAAGTGRERPHVEVLQLLAAADKSDSSRPPELITARGFRVSLAYDEGIAPDAASICVLVRCPPELIGAVQGKSAFLWNGTERFELGQFDTEGKAIGALPAGIEISLSDFAMGKIKLEEPPPTTDP